MAEMTVSLLVEGGKASGGPPLATSVGPLGVDIKKIVAEINEKTKEFVGVSVPVKVIIDKDTKEFRLEIGIPSVSSLVKKELGLEKGAKAEPGKKPEPVGDIKMEQVVKIAKIKISSMNATELKSAVLNVLGTCVSVGVTCEGLDPRKIQRKVKKGEFDALFK